VEREGLVCFGFSIELTLEIEIGLPICGDLATLRNISATGPSLPLFGHSAR
jgi:hypothetical protein